MDRPAADFFRILEVLVSHDVSFVIVGGVGAVLQGAPVSTFDLDIVHDREAQNVARLQNALIVLNAYYRNRGTQKIAPGPEQLRSTGHQLLMTDAGPLDILGVIGDNEDYQKLVSDSVEMSLHENTMVRVLSLRAIIRLKERLGRDKDQAALAVLRRTLAEQNR
jgi:hypothetical protein